MEVRLLGPVEVVDGSQPVPVAGAKQVALLALLALHVPHPVADAHLLDGLWGDALPSRPANALQKRVSELRKVLGAERLVRSGNGYALGIDPTEVDAVAFEQQVAAAHRLIQGGDLEAATTLLERALQRWRGPALADVVDHDFARDAGARLDELRVVAREHRMECELALGRHREVLVELQSLVREHPLRERLWAQLMVALYRSGRQAEALAAYQDARRELLDQVGVDPGPDLRALEAAVLAQDPALDLRPVDAGTAADAVGATDEPSPPERVPEPPAMRLPAGASVFVGRHAERRQLLAHIDRHRLVTLTGPGGAGKTRLALEVARDLQPSRSVWFVELAPLRAGPAVAEAVAEAVGARDAGSQHAVPTPVGRVIAQLDQSEGVLLLDNCEHVLEDAAQITAQVLAACPGIRILATSREPLAVSGEAQLPVGALPDLHAEELFAERAREARPDVRLDGRTRSAVAEICQRLDGLPLAIELAAARVKALPVESIARRLDDRFRLLTGGSRTALPRHQTLRAAVEWSFDLLFDDERRLFTRAAVFAGTFDLEAATAVGGDAEADEFEVLDLISRLVDKSLLVVRGDRFAMLETLRQFGLHHLATDGTLDDVRRAHAEHFARQAAAAYEHVFAPEQVEWLDRVEEDHDNHRAALDWALASAPDLAMSLISALAAPWWIRGHGHEARHLLDLALEADDRETTERVKALRWAAQLADATGWSEHPEQADRELDLARRRVEEAMAIAERLGADWELGHCQRLYAVALVRHDAYRDTGDLSRLHEEYLARSSTIFTDLRDDWGVAFAGLTRTFAALASGNLDLVDDICTTIEPLIRRHGDRIALDRLLMVRAVQAEMRGQIADAVALHREGLSVCGALGFEEGRAGHLVALAALGAPDGDPSVTRDLGGALDELGVAASSRAAAGDAALRAGKLAQAEALHREALERYRALGLTGGITASMLALAAVAEAAEATDETTLSDGEQDGIRSAPRDASPEG